MMKGITIRVTVFVALQIALAACRWINNPGTTYVTQLSEESHWEVRLANPCGISGRNGNRNEDSNRDSTNFYLKMVTNIESALLAHQMVQIANPKHLMCEGFNMSSLPATPCMTDMKLEDTFVQVYESGIYLLAHLEIMTLDRKIDSGMDRCGNEYQEYMKFVNDLINKINDVLCTLFIQTSEAERSTFTYSRKKLLKTEIFRYSTCSDLDTRDCLVLRETHHTLLHFQCKFNQLLAESKLSRA